MRSSITLCKKCKTVRNIEEAPQCPICESGYKNEPERYRDTVLNRMNAKEYIDSLPRAAFVGQRSRAREEVEETKKAVFTLRDRYKVSFEGIGRILGYRDHTTVFYLYHRYKRIYQE